MSHIKGRKDEDVGLHYYTGRFVYLFMRMNHARYQDYLWDQLALLDFKHQGWAAVVSATAFQKAGGAGWSCQGGRGCEMFGGDLKPFISRWSLSAEWGAVMGITTPFHFPSLKKKKKRARVWIVAPQSPAVYPLAIHANWVLTSATACPFYSIQLYSISFLLILLLL